jgi:hypothetical protein
MNFRGAKIFEIIEPIFMIVLGLLDFRQVTLNSSSAFVPLTISSHKTEGGT